VLARIKKKPYKLFSDIYKSAGALKNMQKITPHLWFKDQAEEAAKFYVSVFASANGRSKMGNISRYGKAGAKVSGMPEGSVMTIEFELAGQKFIALNGGPVFEFTPAVSFLVKCETQEEIDHFWEKLTEEGDETAQQCGWLKDKYGLSWQIVPAALDKMMKNEEAAERVMNALLPMKKIDMEGLNKAYGES